MKKHLQILMREIKFRAWFDGQMYDDAYINRYTLRHWIDSIKCPLMQFTGLKDKNGKEIYEADIVRLVEPNRLYTVEFSDYGYKMVHAAPEMNRIEWGGIHRIHELGWNVEVIGNIYENPELLR